MLCAGNTTHEVSICFGDSGGPLTHFNGTRHVIVGVTSFVMGYCGSTEFPEGFARVSHVMDWIKSHGDNYVQNCSGLTL